MQKHLHHRPDERRAAIVLIEWPKHCCLNDAYQGYTFGGMSDASARPDFESNPKSGQSFAQAE